MSAPGIPNLLSMRGPSSRGGAHGRGRGHGRRGAGSSPQQRHDAVIQGTDTDAAIARLSAVGVGYLQDPFASLFVDPAQSRRMAPIINRGSSFPLSVDPISTCFVAAWPRAALFIPPLPPPSPIAINI